MCEKVSAGTVGGGGGRCIYTVWPDCYGGFVSHCPHMDAGTNENSCRTTRHCLLCSSTVHGKNSRSCVLSVQVPGRAQYCAMPAQRIWCCVVPWAAIGSGGPNVARYLADLVCPNGLGLREGTHTHLPWARRYFPLREIYVVAHFLWETNTLVRVIPAPQTDHNPCLFFTISPIMLFFFCKMGRDFD